MTRGSILVVALTLSATSARASASDVLQPGTTFQIVHSYQNEDRSSSGDSGSSNGSSLLIERVIAVRDGGVEVVYDVPVEKDQPKEWQFPFRVFKPGTGPLQLLNESELESRIDPWLKLSNWDRSICGRWIFTWNAFKIECDPRKAPGIVEGLGIWHDSLGEGVPFSEDGFREPVVPVVESSDATSTTYLIKADLDPAAIIRKRAEADVVVSEIMHKPITLEQALVERRQEKVSGSITLRIVVAASGLVKRRMSATEVITAKSDGETETQTSKQSVERRSPAFSG